jgi:hypothetical protein
VGHHQRGGEFAGRTKQKRPALVRALAGENQPLHAPAQLCVTATGGLEKRGPAVTRERDDFLDETTDVRPLFG